uniref:CAS family C-terminal domain-containing protein n=1 Tax=Syphacia muris TaxID=451379 RepID=A0A0N5AIN7_9BILA
MGICRNLSFGSIFPLSNGESFSNIGRSTSDVNGFTPATTGVVHNIPIKIEGECDSSNSTCSNEQYFLTEEQKNNNVQNSSFPHPGYFLAFLQFYGTLSSSSLPLFEQKNLNSYQGEPQTYVSNYDNERKISTPSAIPTSTTTKTTNRPPIAPKPKFGYLTSQNKDQNEPSYITSGNNNVVKVAWRLAKLAAPLDTQSDTASWSRKNLKDVEHRSKDQDSTNNLIKELESLYTDDIGSPSSSGIVADSSDAATDYQQSSSNLSERDSTYDYPRTRPEFSGVFGRAIPPCTPQPSEKLSTITSNFDNDRYETVSDDTYSGGSKLRLPNNPFPNGFNRDQNVNFREKPSIIPKPPMAVKRSDFASSNDVANARKQAICSRLEESSRLLDFTINNIRETTSPPGWRQPHVLQKSLLNIKELVETTVEALKEFLDAAGRIALDPAHLENEGLQRLLNPLRNSYLLLSQLKQNIEHTGWTLSALARPKKKVGVTIGNDALDQFVAVVKQVPSDCLKMYKWASMLVPSNEVHFLALLSNDQLTGSYDSFEPFLPQNFDVLKRLSDFDNSSDDSKRCSLTSTVTASSSSDVQTPTVLNRLNYNNTINSQISEDTNLLDNSLDLSTAVTNESNLHSSLSNGESRVFEEDDLESVLSDRESLSQDYTLVDGIYNPVRKRPLTNGPPSLQLSLEMKNTLSEDDRQLLRFYAPQLESHIDFLSRSIEEFLSIVEEQLPPHEFVQKSKLIILTAHKLIYIGDNIAQCVSAPFLTSMAKKTADRLCCVLKNCVQATKNAADKYPDVSAVKTMVDSVVTVSHAAFDLKLLVKDCC